MIIDPLNIFEEIKNILLLKYKDSVSEIYACGSRTKGDSIMNKWDFDILMIYKNTLDIENLNVFVNSKLKDKIDENGKPVKVDIFAVTEENKIKYNITTKNYRNAHLLFINRV